MNWKVFWFRLTLVISIIAYIVSALYILASESEYANPWQDALISSIAVSAIVWIMYFVIRWILYFAIRWIYRGLKK